MNQESALSSLHGSGFCLWVGAGVTKHLASVRSEVEVPLWSELTVLLESEIPNFEPPAYVDIGYPARLQVALHRLGRRKFQRLLRERICNPLCKALVESLKSDIRTVPSQYCQVARLGAGASSVVNFNIESLTSTALLASSISYSILSFDPSGGYNKGSSQRGNNQTIAYHPHGSISESGLCVLTEQDYRTLTGTLALELSVHLAFGQSLAIVGMSLDDSYLREQLEKFRPYIGRVFWFTPNPTAHRGWAWKNNINVVVGSWEEFWLGCDSHMSPSLDELAIRDGWATTTLQAHVTLQNPTQRRIERSREAFPDESEEGLLDYMMAARNRGEVGNEGSVHGLFTFEENFQFAAETPRRRRALRSQT